MKKILLTALLLTLSYVQADELSDAYSKEYAFLKAQKNELNIRFKSEQSQQRSAQANAKFKVEALQEKIVNLTNTTQNLQEALGKMNESLAEITDNSEVTSNVLMQAHASLKEYNIDVDESNNTTNGEKLKTVFSDSAQLYKTLSSIRTEQGKFFLKDGSSVEGDIVKVGNVAAYGLSTKVSGALAPAGEGTFKIWNIPGSDDDAKAMAEGKKSQNLDIFVYENVEKEVEYKKEKTYEDTIKSGGIIGYIILALGAFGAFLVLLRMLFLMRSGSNVTKISNIVVEKFENCETSQALEAIKNHKGATARVIKTTIRNIKRDRAHVEDIVMESILNESTALDRYGNFILVLAAVAPLLGLLGTVAGMIATFDIITEYGTGDPKLLAGGISEALVTTMFGLIVAIPLLLVGNLLAGWAQNIKDDMEQSALHIVNLYEKNRAKCKHS
ncbi:MAG TPA: flagellar motor protein MotA [Campylobacterales bacterium]|nr:flagellar motor protein MotA [Campylobacterales bacterium]